MLTVKTLSKFYYHKPVLENISFHIQKGDIVAVMGKNGAGKTTLLKTLTGLVLPNGGKVKFNSVELSVNNPSSRKDFFYLGHEPGFYSVYTCFENLSLCTSLYGLQTSSSIIEDVIEKVGLRSVKFKPIRFFSQGMLQRLKIAAAELIPWKILLFDEPFNGLDEKGICMVEKRIENWKERGKSMVFVCHSVDWVLKSCSRVILLDEHQVVLDEPTSDEIKIPIQNVLSGNSSVDEIKN
ncbi:MAG: ATP-binding cassette domain-containing protein [Candidatus Marinimicrobia bacterium]|jgi:ABC-2 type transport system ATP-binding protein|nr:ATP-binding cassette domain-containing protein [Candidatus Neomarinimicrobiota bacterium]